MKYPTTAGEYARAYEDICARNKALVAAIYALLDDVSELDDTARAKFGGRADKSVRQAVAALGPAKRSPRYKTVKRNGKTVLLHRWLVEQARGRPLGADEHVHHKNHDTHDNRPENLEVTSEIEHQRHHHPLVHAAEKTCVMCLRRFTPHKTKRKRQQTCSWPCRNALIAVNRHGVPIEVARARI